ncbi:A disintegrin and metalloproteinase with thrombospondin motifs 1 [Elysia marginata]|uniref:A disintegrin and metalloproteinase with thrombospondin motifs 1 n=1 Tax=Elysia marginata TaxID=1093978 RepID=A0AAV4HVT6_9GAST|nr:A disintegrin and metalloproteinase with thrombospondin motifs 1 [Elysia marginata]
MVGTLKFSSFISQIDIRYRTISDSDIAVGTRVIHLKILTTDSEDDFIEDLISSGTFDGGAGLNAFRTWIMDPSNGIPNADHYMYFTGFDIRSASGVAYQDRVCTASGVSISENTFSAGVGTVAAHELGHSLSASHDSSTLSCSDSTGHIMTAIFSIPVTSSNRGNPWKFSSCSISSIKSYLGTVSCTQPGNTGTTDTLPPPTGNDRAGIALDRDNQCKQYFRDSSSSYCSGVQNQNGGESNLCSGMFCSRPSNPSICETVLPLEYTTCGSGKWCRLGFCVDEGVEPTNAPPGEGPSTPQNIFDCIPFLLRGDWIGLLTCFR